MADNHDYKALQCEHTMNQVLKKIDYILDFRERNGGHLTMEEIEALKCCWKTLYYVKLASS